MHFFLFYITECAAISHRMMQCHVTSQCGDVRMRMPNLQSFVVFTQFLYPRTKRPEKNDLQNLVEKNVEIRYEKPGSCGGDVEVWIFFHQNVNNFRS